MKNPEPPQYIFVPGRLSVRQKDALQQDWSRKWHVGNTGGQSILGAFLAVEPRKRSWLGPTLFILVYLAALWATRVVGYRQGYVKGYQDALTACESLRGVEKKEDMWNFKRRPVSAWKKTKNCIDGSQVGWRMAVEKKSWK